MEDSRNVGGRRRNCSWIPVNVSSREEREQRIGKLRPIKELREQILEMQTSGE